MRGDAELLCCTQKIASKPQSIRRAKLARPFQVRSRYSSLFRLAGSAYCGRQPAQSALRQVVPYGTTLDMSDQRRSQLSLISTFPTFLFHLNDSPLDYSGRWDRTTSIVGYVFPLANQVTAKGSNASTSLLSGLPQSSGISLFSRSKSITKNQLWYLNKT